MIRHVFISHAMTPGTVRYWMDCHEILFRHVAAKHAIPKVRVVL